jgi:hypothetical protein
LPDGESEKFFEKGLDMFTRVPPLICPTGKSALSATTRIRNLDTEDLLRLTESGQRDPEAAHQLSGFLLNTFEGDEH